MSLIKNSFTATGTGPKVYGKDERVTTWTHTAKVAGTGAVSATVLIEATNDPSDDTSWITLATFTLSGTNSAQDVISGVCTPMAVRHRCTAISGTSATATVTSSGA